MTLFERIKIWLINLFDFSKPEPVPIPKPAADISWLPPDVKTNGELRPHLPSRTNRPRRYDEVQRDRKLQRKGAR